MPSIYSTSVDIPPSFSPTPSTSRNQPLRTTTLPDQLDMFKKQDRIANFGSISESLCPKNFKLQYNNNKANFYKMENSTKFDIPIVINNKTNFYKMKHSTKFDIPIVTQCIVVDEAQHAKLFLNGSPIWVLNGSSYS